MNTPNPNKATANASDGSGGFQQTLRLMASVPAPEGLEERVKAELNSASQHGRVLPWTTLMHRRGGWLHSQPMQALAAAAMVCVVLGGSWAVYTHVEPVPGNRMTVMPRIASPGGFSSAGAMRTPQTLNGPVLKHPQLKVKESAAEAKAVSSAEATNTKEKTKHKTKDKQAEVQSEEKSTTQ